MIRTKIVCTIGPASRDPATLRSLVLAGMDVARLNFSHGNQDYHGENIARIRHLLPPRLISGKVDVPGLKLEIGGPDQ